MVKNMTKDTRYIGMMAPDKLRAYLKLKKFTHKKLGGILGVSGPTVGQWMCENQRPPLILRYQIEYLTTKDMEFPTMARDWLTAEEQGRVDAGILIIKRLRRLHKMDPVTIRDEVKGRL